MNNGSRLESVRERNLSLLAKLVIESPKGYSRAELAQLSSLNPSTVTRLAETLISKGIVVEEGAQKSSSAGRPSVTLVPAAHTHAAIGAELSDSSVRTITMDLSGRILAEHFVELTFPNSPEDIFRIVRESIITHAKQLRQIPINIVGIACGLPGIISRQTRTLHISPNFGWRDIYLPSLLDLSEIGFHDPVVFENSVNLAAHYELFLRIQKSVTTNSFLFISGSSGIGSAIVKAGVLDDGQRGWAGEIGHTLATNSPKQCSCGSRGCLETEMGRPWLLESAGFARTTPIGHFFAALERNEKITRQALNNAVEIFGQVLASALNMVDLPEVVFHGLLADLFPYIYENLEKSMSSRLLYSAWEPVKLSASLVREGGAAEGAAWKMLMAFVNQPDSWIAPSPVSLNYYSIENTPEVEID